MKEMLYEGLILREKQFRELLKEHDWEQYKDHYVAVYCSTDAIIPKWAYMLVVQYAHNIARDVLFGEPDDVFRTVAGKVLDRKSTRLNSSHVAISYAVFCFKQKNRHTTA